MMELTIDTLDNFLNLTLSFDKNEIGKFPFPKLKNVVALNGTAFNFALYADGKLVEGAGLPLCKDSRSYFGYEKWLGNTFSFNSDTIDLHEGSNIYFTIPFYAFGKLRAGEHVFELKVSQNMFCSEPKFRKLHVDSFGDSTYHDTRNFVKAGLISCVAKFKLILPKIFKTTLFCQSIELRNDSVYSPVGMDNTIWNSSYPDVYWTIDFPNNEFYCRSDYQKSTSLYDIKDTFYLYHYTPNDSIYIGVWDHDDLSRDDYISYERFSLKKFGNNTVTKFSFDNIKEFRLKVSRQGYINK